MYSHGLSFTGTCRTTPKFRIKTEARGRLPSASTVSSTPWLKRVCFLGMELGFGVFRALQVSGLWGLEFRVLVPWGFRGFSGVAGLGF